MRGRSLSGWTSYLWIGLTGLGLFSVTDTANAQKLVFDKLNKGTPTGWTAFQSSTPVLDANDCCQCDGAVAACGPPVSGACGMGANGMPCEAVFSASCDGPSGLCRKHTLTPTATPTRTPTFTPTATPTRTPTQPTPIGPNDCCQCNGTLPACGPPSGGVCGTGADGQPCAPVFNAACVGGTGMCVTFTPTPTATPTETPPTPTPRDPFENFTGNQACNDGIDNDLNGLTDCRDPVCFGIFPCPAPVPVVSAPAGLLLAGGLVGAGLLALARLRRRSK